MIRLPEWIWGGDLVGLLESASLQHRKRPVGTEGVQHSVTTNERYHGYFTPGFVSQFRVLGVAADDEVERLLRADRSSSNIVTSDVLDAQRIEEAMFDEQEYSGGRYGITRRMALIQLRTGGAVRDQLLETVRGARQALVDVQLTNTEESAFPDAEVYAVVRSAALAMRYKMPSIHLRLEHDPGLFQRGPQALAPEQGSDGRYVAVFGSSQGLVDGVYIFECYLSPLWGSLAPFVWAFPAHRGEITLIYSFGRALAGVDGLPAEPLQAINFRGASQTVDTPDVSPAATQAAITWWTQKLDNILSVVSDPALHTDKDGNYLPSKHLNSMLSMEQLFRRVAAVQRGHKDKDARRLAFFSVLDTLQRLTGRDITMLSRRSYANKVLTQLETAIPDHAQQILLPACYRAIRALDELQKGFFLTRQTGMQTIKYVSDKGQERELTLTEATAQYVKLLRNATHGFGDITERNRSEVLLAHHDGVIPDDLAFLAWLYLLDLLNNTDRLQFSLWAGGAR
ncbi:hypothetical protein [Klenkia sp. PcliD-1-E]|uniref:hypothetical protein n=1 Tax=Klenkia sp. PcliD-1-E TaxID=2954492 RepID=UPI002097DEDE|nr:hypothetical protein [Klenkia sp. PcliD-1-E]MCO7220837.1 hypothetical protein [Klenkia sp. PcliD-1-E]